VTDSSPRDPGSRRARDEDYESEVHPGYANYPNPRDYSPPNRRPSHLPPLSPASGEPYFDDRYTDDLYSADAYPGASYYGDGFHGRPAARPEEDDGSLSGSGVRLPKKITVTRVAAMRSRQLTRQGIATFHRAATADGADKSGLTALTYTTIFNFATDAAVAVALANTLFFSATTAESKGMVALYLLITIAPFAVIAPLIGPALDKVQHGRRLALAASFLGRTALALVLIFNYDMATKVFDPWVLYPSALGMLVLSKSFGVLKAAVTPRVLPPEIDLVRTNSRLTVFGLVGGTIVGGAVASLCEAFLGKLFGLPGAMIVIVFLTLAGAFLSMRIPSWVEVTEGEVPATLTYHGDGQDLDLEHRPNAALTGRIRQPLGRAVVTGLWGNSTIRILTGFITLYIAFVAKSRTEHEPLMQVAMLALVGVAAGIGNFGGNAAGARLKLGKPAAIVLRCTIGVTLVTIFAALTDSLVTAALATLVAAAASALAKVSLDASIQNDLPDESRASAFGRSETVLQLSWVFGGALGVLLPTEYWIGFTVISVLMLLGTIQTVLTYRGSSLLPGLGGRRPIRAAPEGRTSVPPTSRFGRRARRAQPADPDWSQGTAQ
jgi:MFS family permease